MDDLDSRVALRTPGHFGATTHGVAIAQTTIASAWNVQGSPSNAAFIDATRSALGVSLPLAANTTTRHGSVTALWLGPRSWLVATGDAAALGQLDAKRDAMAAAGGALFDVSAGRAAWTIAGPCAAAVLQSGCPLDLHPRAFVAGACAQSLFGHVGALIEKRDDAPTFVLMVARSFARDIEHALAIVAAQYGCDVTARRSY